MYASPLMKWLHLLYHKKYQDPLYLLQKLASRPTPLPLANGRRSPAPVQDFHPKDDAHAERTTNKPNHQYR